MARAAAIEGGEWSSAGSALTAGGARLVATPRRDREPSAAPARGGSGFAALVSLVVHAAIVAAAALSLGATQPTGEPNAIAVELAASTGEAPAAPTPAPDAESTRAAPAPAADVATSVPTSALQAAPPQPTETSDAAGSTPAKTPDAAAPPAPNADVAAIATPPKSADAADATDMAPTADAAQAAAAPAPVSSPAQSASALPEADFAAAPAAPRAEPKHAKPPTARAVARLEPVARPSGARAASAPAPARGEAELAAYRNALLAKIWGAARYPEAARERGASGVATVRFALDGAGAVTLADLAQSSGDRALDDEAMAAVRRASPLPAPPTGAPQAYSAPIRFELR